MKKAAISPSNTLLLLIGICLHFITINAAKPRPSCVWNCEGVKNGHYQSCDPKVGCNHYVSCVARKKMYIRDCPDSLVWDDRLRRCEATSTTCDYQRPNIIYLMADDAGLCDVGFMHDHVDCTGAVGVRTPYLDKLANSGRILTNHYMMPGCTPSRHAFLTGRYPHNSQMQNFILPSNDPHCIPTNIKLLPEHLKDQGYATHATGKWHVGFCKEECLPTNRGFDSFYGLYSGMAHQYTHVTQPPDVPLYDFRDNTILDETANGTHSTTLFTDQAVRLIKAHDKYKPMFIFVAYTAPHYPFQVPDEYLDQFTDPDMHEDRKRVLAMMLQLDDGAKSIVKALKKQGMWDNTFLIFSSDNGGDVLSHQYNGPLRGAKGTLYEGGTRAAAFVHGKMVRTMMDIETSDGLMHVSDWFASIISLAQGNANGVNGLDQTDMLLKGKSSKRSDMFYNIDMEPFKLFGQAAVRQENMKLIWGYQGTYEGWGWNVTHMADFPENLALFPPHMQTPANQNARNGALMGMRNFDIDEYGNITIPGVSALFDLAADPNEMNNLAGDAAYSSTVITLQNMIINEILNNYVKPQSHHLEDWTPQVLAAAEAVGEEGSWATGWCDNVTITV